MSIANDFKYVTVENADTVHFYEWDSIKVFKNGNYKILILVRITSKIVHPTICIFDTGAGSSLIPTSLPSEYGEGVQFDNGILSRSSFNNLVTVYDMNILFIGVEDSKC